jgi:hypothetical protein
MRWKGWLLLVASLALVAQGFEPIDYYQMTVETEEEGGGMVQTVKRVLTFTCVNGEVTDLTGELSSSLIGATINCASATQLVNTEIDRYVAHNSSIYYVDVYSSLSFADSSNPTILKAFYDTFTGNNNQFSINARKRRSVPVLEFNRRSRRSDLAVSTGDAGAIIAGLAAVGSIPGIGTAIAIAGLGAFFGTAIDDTSGQPDSFIQEYAGPNTSFSSCAGILSGGWGTVGLAGCLAPIVQIEESTLTELENLKAEVDTVNQIITAVQQQVQALQGDILAVEQLQNAQQQSIDNLAKVQTEAAYAQQQAAANNAITAQGVADAAGTQNVNNNNLLQLIQQSNSNTAQIAINLQNQLAYQSSVNDAEITLETRVVYVQLYQQILAVQQALTTLQNAQALRLDSSNAQVAGQINSILNTVSTIQNAAGQVTTIMGDIEVAVRDLIADRDGLGMIPILFWNLETPLFNQYHQLPFVQDWGHYPTNLTDFTNLGVRVLSEDSTQIYNTATGDWQSCTYPFNLTLANPLILEAFETTPVVTWNVPPQLTRFSPQYGDAINIQVLVGSTWQYLTAQGCSSTCTLCTTSGSLPLCTTTNQASASAFQLQSYALYKEAHVTSSVLNVVNFTSASCTTTQLNATTLFIQCVYTLPYPARPILTNTTLYGTNCTAAITNTTVLDSSGLPNNCTYGPTSSNGTLVYYTNATTITPVIGSPINMLSGDQFYLDFNIAEVGVYRVQPNFITGSTSNALCLQPVADINPTFVFTANNANATQQALQTYVNNNTILNIGTEGGGDLFVSGGCLASNPASNATIAQFRITPYFGVAGVNDTGIPVAKRSVPVERPRRSTPTPATCTWSSSFALVTDPTTYNEANIAACTAQPGCILARFQRPNTITLIGGTPVYTGSPVPSGSTLTLGLGSYYGTVKSGTNYEFILNNIIFGHYAASETDILGIQLSTGMSVQFLLTDPKTGIQATTFVSTLLQQPFTNILLNYETFALISASGVGAVNTWIFELVVDYEPDYPSFQFTDVCVSNYQSDGTTLSSNQCSFLSTGQATISIPLVGSTSFYYLLLTSTPLLYAQQVAPPAQVYYAGSSASFVPYGANSAQLTADPSTTNPTWAAVLTSFKVTTSLEICFATCATVGNDRATCLSVEYDRCVWAYNASTGSNTCVERVATASSFNISNVVAGIWSFNFDDFGTSQCPGSTAETYSYTLCENGNPQYIYVQSSTVIGTLSFCNDGIFSSDSVGPNLLVMSNPNCSTTWSFIVQTTTVGTDNNGGGVYSYLYYTYPTYSTSTLNIPNSCNPSDLATYFISVWGNSSYYNSVPAQYLCLQTKSVSVVGGKFATGQYASVASAANATGAWLPKPFIGTPPNCVWDLVANTCENYDSVYSNEDTQVEIKCEDRLLSQNNVGACAVPPPSGIVYSGSDYRPLCVYVLPSNTSIGSCVSYNFATPPPFAGSGVVSNPGPYTFPANVSGTATTILSTCLTPGTQCYFENTNIVAYTNNWYQTQPLTSLAFPCTSYSNDPLGCPLKSWVNGTQQCYYNNGVCAPICSTLSNNGSACVNNLPYNTCFYDKIHQSCNATTSNYMASPLCANYNCYSAQYICYEFTNNEAACMNNSLCTWLYDNNNATGSYCEMQTLVTDPECNPNGVVESFCNVTQGFGLSAIVTQTLGACAITNTELTGSAYISACVSLVSDSPGNPYCVYTQIGNENFCAAPGDATVAGFISQNQALMSVTQITNAQYAQATFNPNQTYTMTYSQLVNTVIRPEYLTSLATIRNLVTTIPDSVTAFYACSNSSYQPIGRYCCLSSQVGSNGQCGTTNYTNPWHPVTIFQGVYETLCQEEAAALSTGPVTYDTGVHTATIPISYMMNSLQSLPTPLDTMNCPTFPNDTSFVLNTTSVSPYTLSVMVQALKENIKQGTIGCTVDFSGDIDETLLLTNLGALGWYYGSQFWTVQLYNGASFNLTQFFNLQSSLYDQPITFTDTNITNDWFADIYSQFLLDINTFIAMKQVETCSDPRCFQARLPTGVQVTDKYLPSTPGVYTSKNKRANMAAVSAATAPVYKVLGINPVCEGTITYTLADGSTQSQEFTTCQMTDPNTNLLPPITGVFTHINDRQTGQVCSPRYSPGVACTGQDWYTAISSGPTVTSVNYTDYITFCPESSLDVSIFSNSVCAYSTPLNLQNPNYQWCGVTYDSDLGNSSSLDSGLALTYLQANGTMSPPPGGGQNQTTLYQAWLNRIATAGTAVVLAFMQGIEQAWITTLDCPFPLSNYIPPAYSVFGSNGTLLYSQDVMAACWNVYYPIYLSSQNNTASALNAAVTDVLEPLVSAGTNAYCGNCGAGYLTQCDQPYRYITKVGELAANYGICSATRAYTITNQTNYQWPFVANPGTVTMLVTIEIDQPITAFEGVFSTQCPNSASGTSNNPFSCSSASGVNVCFVYLSNPLSTANIEVVVSNNVTSESLNCNQPQTLNIPPLGTVTTQFVMCEQTSSVLTVIQQSTGATCFVSGVIVTSTSIVQQFANQTTTVDLIAVTTDQLQTDYLNLLNSVTVLQNNPAVNTANFTVALNQVYSAINVNITAVEGQIANLGAGLVPLTDQFAIIQTNVSLLEQYIQFLFFNQSQGLDVQISESSVIGAINSNIAGIVGTLANQTALVTQQIQQNNEQYDNQTTTIEGLERTLNNLTIAFNQTLAGLFNIVDGTGSSSASTSETLLIVIIVLIVVLFTPLAAFDIYLLVERSKARKKRLAQGNGGGGVTIQQQAPPQPYYQQQPPPQPYYQQLQPKPEAPPALPAPAPPAPLAPPAPPSRFQQRNIFDIYPAPKLV